MPRYEAWYNNETETHQTDTFLDPPCNTEVHTHIHTNKFLTRRTCQVTSESGVLQWCQNSYE